MLGHLRVGVVLLAAGGLAACDDLGDFDPIDAIDGDRDGDGDVDAGDLEDNPPDLVVVPDRPIERDRDLDGFLPLPVERRDRDRDRGGPFDGPVFDSPLFEGGPFEGGPLRGDEEGRGEDRRPGAGDGDGDGVGNGDGGDRDRAVCFDCPEQPEDFWADLVGLNDTDDLFGHVWITAPQEDHRVMFWLRADGLESGATYTVEIRGFDGESLLDAVCPGPAHDLDGDGRLGLQEVAGASGQPLLTTSATTSTTGSMLIDVLVDPDEYCPATTRVVMLRDEGGRVVGCGELRLATAVDMEMGGDM